MGRLLKILCLEDDPDDAELVAATLTGEGIACEVTRAADRDEYQAALARGGFDVILADYKLPAFDVMTALALASDELPGVPFILVSGTVGEERAIEFLRGGVTDYVVKDRLKRLAPAVRRALSEARERADRQLAEAAFRHEAAVSAALLKASTITSAYLDWDEVAAKVAALVPRLVSCESAAVVMIGDDGWLMHRSASGLPEGGVSRFLSIRERLEDFPAALQVMGSKKPLAVPGNRLHGLVPQCYKEVFGPGEMIIAPVLAREKVSGFLVVDFDSLPSEPRVAEILQGIAGQLGVAHENSRLVADLEDMLVSVVSALASAIDAKSPWTKGHSERVTGYSVRIARALGLPGAELDRLQLAGLLHDIGKIGTLDAVLDKPGKLTEEEFKLVMEHPNRGCEILSPIKQFRDIITTIRHHHERWDGGGYPEGLKGCEIPLAARILAVADSFDSMTADRPYRPAPGLAFAMGEFRRCAGTQFDPSVVNTFLTMLDGEVQAAA